MKNTIDKRKQHNKYKICRTNTGCLISSVLHFRALDNNYFYTYEVML